jgi:GNAT superfamily N-acetyltransferase
VLKAADAGDARMAKVLRILTPLIKFRTCRDARKVAGDAMEVRGGCGYIEEWSDARVLRDAHLGSIWEGTSNIVALDVARATRREGALAALAEHLDDLQRETGAARLPAGLPDMLKSALDFMNDVAADRAKEADVRQAASAVYNATSATVLSWESAKIEGMTNARAGSRRAIAESVLRHKLLPRDPLARAHDEAAEIDALIGAEAMPAREAAE